MDKLLQASAISVQFGGLKVIHEVDLQIAPGETLGLIGPNGAGKTTFVNVLSGFIKPRTGKVMVGGRDITGTPPDDRARHGLVRTFQAVRLFHSLTVWENVEAAAYAIGLSPREARAETDAILRRLQLAHLARHTAGSLSYGYERRVGIARALVTKPKFIMLDEPAAGLNEAEAYEFLEFARDMRADDCGILLIEHNMRIVFELCDRVQVLQSGRTLAEGTPDYIRKHDLVREAYLGKQSI
jgi:ABC-type branched-subunit amino acid transport system ATPase component